MAKHPNYELFEAIGKSENSTVFRAWDLLLSRDVAIKELASDPGSDGGQSEAQRVQQFLKEASFLAQFEHEHILRIHTVDQERAWIVMELMKGSLANQIHSKPMEPDTVRSILRQVLSALDFLHNKNKVHGSVRPSNLLINDQGIVKLSDFEASGRDGELRVPQGTKKYLAPELIKSEFGDFGPSVDLYCLGFTALELLTGKKFDSLFPGTGEGAIDADVAWLRWHSSDEALAPVAKLAPRVPTDLANVLDQLLQKNSADRPANAAAVLKLLNESPLIPVELVATEALPVKKPNPKAILPSKAVSLKPPKTRKKTVENSRPKTTQSSKNDLNDFLGRPYVLWPICACLLIGALLIGLYLQDGEKDTGISPPPIAGIQPPVEKKIEPELLDINLNIFPGHEDTQLTVGGELHSLDDLKLLPGEYEITLEKKGFESFATTLQIDKDHTSFDVTLTETPKIVEKDPDVVEPNLITVSIAVFPPEANLELDGVAFEPKGDEIQIDPNEFSELVLAGHADGYESKTKSWSLDEIANLNYRLQLSLDKAAKPANQFALPSTLSPKPGTSVDETTGLPHRVLVNAITKAPMELALVNPGAYQFGTEDSNRRTWEVPLKQIEIERPFYVGLHEVSNAQYSEFEVENSVEQTTAPIADKNPATGLSVLQAAKFCDWIGGRLPTEFQWEAAVRGPNDAGYPLPWSFANGSDEMAATKCNLFRGEKDSDNKLATVDSLPDGANEIGLLNTIGNAAEWCDAKQGADKFIIKGCSHRMPPGDHVRVSWRGVAPWTGTEDIGFRVVVPVSTDEQYSPALSFVPPTNIDSLLVSAASNETDPSEQQEHYTKTVEEIANQFTGPAELVIDSGGFMSEITDVAFSPDGKNIAVAGAKVVRIWDVGSGRLLHTLRGDMSRTSYGNVNAVAWSPDGQSLLVGISDYRAHGNIRVYSTENYDEIQLVLTGHSAPCRKLTFSRDGKYLVSVDSDGLVLIRNWQSKEIENRIAARDRDQPIYDLMTFPSDQPFMLGIDFEGPQVFSAENGQRLGPQDEMPDAIRGWLVDIYNNLVKFPFGSKAQPRILDFRMDEGKWAGAGDKVVDGRSRFWVRVWESRAPVSSASAAQEIGGYDKHRWNITAISLQPGGTLVASGDKFGEVHVWDSITGERKFKLAGQGKPIYEVAFDKSSNRIAFGTRPYTPKDWKRNNHGDATQVIDLRQRAIYDADTVDDLQLLREQPEIGQDKVNISRQGANYFVERIVGNQPVSKYRISSGRNPTAFSLLDAPKLGVQQPIVFGDNEGLFALWDTATDELKRAFIGHGNLVSAISASNNGKLLATSSTDRTIRLWSLEDHKPTGIFDFKFENSVVREVVQGSSSQQAGVRVGDQIVSIDGMSLTEMFEAMLTDDFDYIPGQQVPVVLKRGNEEEFEYQMELASGYDFSEPVLNFYMGDNGQWIIWHPQGYYDASPGADRLIGWHVNRGFDKSSSFFEVQQFREKLYRPDLIDEILETGSLAAALVSLNPRGEKKEEFDFRKPEIIAEYHPPSVRIISPTDAWQTETASVTVTGEANSVNGLPITALTLLHNGSVAKVFRPTRNNQLSMKIEYDINLTSGANDLVLIAANSKSTSQGEHIVIDLNRPRSQILPDAVVLAIGVSEFENSLQPLPHAASDAQAFTDAIKNHEKGKLYAGVDAKILSGYVSDDEIMDGFQWLADNTSEGNVAIVYIASYGLLDKRDNFYLGASNTKSTKARSTAVSWRDLIDTLQLDLPESKRMVFLDLKPTSNSIRPGLRNPLLDLATPEMGTIFLSSNTLQQETTPATNQTQGAFLQAVMETISDQKFDTNPSPGDAMFNPVELAAGVVTRIKDLTADRQQPVFFTPEFSKFANVLELRN